MIRLLELSGNGTGALKTLSFDPRTERFVLNAERSGTFLADCDAHSQNGIRDLSDFFRKTHSGEKLLPEETIEALARELEYFAQNRFWEDEKKLRLMAFSFQEIAGQSLLFHPGRS